MTIENLENSDLENLNNEWKKSERECVIQFDESSDKCQIYCSSSVAATKLRKAGIIPEPKDIANDGSFTVVVNKSQISFRKLNENKKDRPKKTMTEEHKKKLAEGRAKKKKEKE